MHRPPSALLFAIAAAIALAIPAPRASADGVAGRFDYYVLSLSWSSGWCRLTGDARQDPQCAPGRGQAFILHGLWPQYERGYPSDCRTTARDPSRGQTAAMADIMGSGGLAWHEWKKHGRCSGLTARDYFAVTREAYGRITIPPVLNRVDRPLRVKPSVIVQAFRAANPGMPRGAVAVGCEDGVIDEVRICLTKDLAPRACSPGAAQSCRLPSALLTPVR